VGRHDILAPSTLRIYCDTVWAHCYVVVASYPGLLTPAFVACSTNAGEGLAKLIMCNDVPGHVEEWHIPRKTASE